MSHLCFHCVAGYLHEMFLWTEKYTFHFVTLTKELEKNHDMLIEVQEQLEIVYHAK